MAYNFPDSPTLGQVFEKWTWNGTGWVLTLPDTDALYVNVSGDIMTGRLSQSVLGFGVAPIVNITGRVDSGFYEYSAGTTALGWPTNNGWHHLLSVTHSNVNNYYATQLCSTFAPAQNVLYWRATDNNGAAPWRSLWDNGSFNPALKADLASPALTGTPTAPTPTAGDNSTKIATTAFTATAMSSEVTRANAAYQAKDPQLFAGIPVVNLAGSYRLVATDAQKCFVGKAAGMGFYIPTNATVPFPIGTAVTFICWVGGTISLNADAGVSAYINLNGAVSAFPRTMSNVGIVTMIKVDTDVWFGNGGGVT